LHEISTWTPRRIFKAAHKPRKEKYKCRFWVCDGVTCSTPWSKCFFEGRLHSVPEEETCETPPQKNYKMDDFKFIKGAVVRDAIRTWKKGDPLTDDQKNICRTFMDSDEGKRVLRFTGPDYLSRFWKHLTSGQSDLSMIPLYARHLIDLVMDGTALPEAELLLMGDFAPGLADLLQWSSNQVLLISHVAHFSGSNVARGVSCEFEHCV